VYFSWVCEAYCYYTVDGGPDENPRYPKTLNAAYMAFRDNNLDALFVACHAPGHSAYNAVERRMAPLSHDLSGFILPHDHYGCHLDSSGKTTDSDLEIANFQKAGETLAEVWSQTVIDGYSVHASYVSSSEADLPVPSQSWCCEHVQQSQYCLQIIKCNDITCCGHRRTNYNEVFPDRFVASLMPFERTDSGISSAPCGDGSGTYGSLFH